eukprot:scaffold62890_cov81-Phaeocystis_antarctica.AAC.2
MRYMLYRASAFNQPLRFDTSSVTNMDRMFEVCSSPCPAPNLQSSPARYLRRGRPPPPATPRSAPHALPATRQAASSLSDANKLLIRCAWAGTSAFASAGYGSSWGLGSCPATFTTKASLMTAVQAFNANPTAAIATYGPIANWDVSAITDMSSLFQSLKNINVDVSSWDTSSVTTMYLMFHVSSTPVLSPICRRTLPCTRWTPSPPSAGPHPRPAPCMPPFRLSAERVCVQPAAELRHLQRHEHAVHVSGALLPVPCLQSAVEPSPAHCVPHGRPPPPASRPEPRPAPHALLSTLGRARLRSTSR